MLEFNKTGYLKTVYLCASTDQAQKVLERFEKKLNEIIKPLLGKPYEYGASATLDAPDKFDCSSFVLYVFRKLGVEIPRISIDQRFFGKEIYGYTYAFLRKVSGHYKTVSAIIPTSGYNADLFVNKPFKLF